jgi:hypothetical protein
MEKSSPFSWSLRAAGLILSFVLVNAVLSAHRWLPDYRWAHGLLPAVEAVALLGLLVFLAWRGGRVARIGAWVLAPVVALYALWAVAEAVVAHAYQRSFVATQDVAFFPSLLDLLFPGVDAMNPWVHVPVLVALGLAAVAGVHWALRGMIRLLRGLGRLRWVGIAALPLLGVPALLTADATVTGLILRQFQMDTTNVVLAAAERSAAESEAPPAERVGTDQPLGAPMDPPANAVPVDARFTRLGSRNVLFFIVESYGYTAYTKPGVADADRKSVV